jgi:hypothetical protein
MIVERGYKTSNIFTKEYLLDEMKRIEHGFILSDDKVDQTISPGKNATIDKGTLIVFIESNDYVKELDINIADKSGVAVCEHILSSLSFTFLVPKLHSLGLKTISDITKSLITYRHHLIEFYYETHINKKEVYKGTCIECLGNFLMAKSWSVEKIIDYFQRNSITGPGGERNYASFLKSAYKKVVKI